MNREIKFRGFETELKTWIYFGIGQRYSSMVDEKSIGQYTGLKDKNGKEIYEGDILLTYSWLGPLGDGKADMYDIAKYVISKTSVGFEVRGDPDKAIEVVGNIYENPELLSRIRK